MLTQETREQDDEGDAVAPATRATRLLQPKGEATGEPGELLVCMNARLRRLLPPRVHVAAAVARLALGGPGIRLANAGLPHPFLLHASERRVEELELNGCPLGLLEERPETGYRVLRLTLAVSRNGHGLADSGGRENLRSSTSARRNCQE